MNELKEVVETAFDEANTEKVWIGAWKLTMRAENSQRTDLDMQPIAEFEEEFSEFSESEGESDLEGEEFLNWELHN